MQKNKKIILIVLILFNILWLFFYFSKTISVEEPLIPQNTEKNIKTVLEINGVRYEEEIDNAINVYDFMDKLRAEKKIDFTEKSYTGMGKLIVSINGIKNSGDKNWIYYVNGLEAQVGVSNYKINKEDIVSWKYEKANY